MYICMFVCLYVCMFILIEGSDDEIAVSDRRTEDVRRMDMMVVSSFIGAGSMAMDRTVAQVYSTKVD